MSPACPVFRVLFMLGTYLPFATAHEPDSVPLALPSIASGTTLFTRLTAAGTGLHTENRYDDPHMWDDLFHGFQVGATGTGIALADYDGDGRPELLVTRPRKETLAFVNRGVAPDSPP